MGEDVRQQTGAGETTPKTNIILENKAAIALITASGTLYAITVLITFASDIPNKTLTVAAIIILAEATGIIGSILGGKNLIKRLRAGSSEPRL